MRAFYFLLLFRKLILVTSYTNTTNRIIAFWEREKQNLAASVLLKKQQANPTEFSLILDYLALKLIYLFSKFEDEKTLIF